MINDPGAWGAANPAVLVLGFSKGFTQADAYENGDFEAIPFKGMRKRLTAAFQRLSILGAGRTIEPAFSPAETHFGFGSLIRCSLSRLNEKTGRRECTGAVMPKAFRENISKVVYTCADQHLAALPTATRLVVMLGSSDPYITGCRALAQRLHPKTYEPFNDVAYRAAGAMWVHIAHPSGMNGFFDTWLQGDPADKSGAKMQLARAAVSASGLTAA